MNDDRLKALRRIATPAPSDAARRRALEAALLAYDEVQPKASQPTQGANWNERLRSIFHRGNWIMDTRISIGLGTAAIALLLLPLGYQLYLSTAMTPVTVDPVSVTTAPSANPPTAPAEQRTEAVSDTNAAEPANPVQPANAPKEDEAGFLAGDEVASGAPAMKQRVMVVPQDQGASAAPLATIAPGAAAPMAMESFAAPAPEPRMLPRLDASGDEFTDFDESPVKVVAEQPVSTFSIDVDTASYSYVRRMLTDGYVPEPDAIRIEELINYFDYDYPAPATASEPFTATMQVYPTPWNPRTQLLQIGIKGYVPPVTEDKASNLVFLIDTSGSMDEPDKLPLLKRALSLLVSQLSANDTVAIVAYAGSAGVVLEPTQATDKAKILGALENLWAGGSTAGAAGIELAYELAAQHKVEGGINRVILATDGDFNVGIDDPEDLVEFIKARRDQGIFLSVLGFGQGNLGDDTMQALAQNGNGNASYIDSYKEARKVLVQEVGGTLETIAKDVKIQVEFNPAVVSEYRLVGYETRALNREDFNNDKVDAGDIGAGHTVTAIYEITPVGSGAELVEPLRYGAQGQGTPTANVLPSEEIGYLKLRYKLPEGTTSALIETPIARSLAVPSLDAASEDARWAAAVAAFGQKLKGSNYGGTMRWDEIKALAQGARGADADGYRAEFIQLIDAAAIAAPDAPVAQAPSE
ncbi:MAG TPA: VWA domain-containing protein [Alphaproteobacteria bacterium]|nr:VWA domain-containing protein [Alphaproteobacteria bacterium]